MPIEAVRAKMADHQREAEHQQLIAEFRRARAPVTKPPKRSRGYLRYRVARRLALAFRLTA